MKTASTEHETHQVMVEFYPIEVVWRIYALVN